MNDLTQYEKGCSPCAIQRKYGLTYAQGYELAERLRKTQELELENKKLKELLEECSPYIGHSAASRMIKNSAGHKKDMKLLTKIDEALK